MTCRDGGVHKTVICLRKGATMYKALDAKN